MHMLYSSACICILSDARYSLGNAPVKVVALWRTGFCTQCILTESVNGACGLVETRDNLKENPISR